MKTSSRILLALAVASLWGCSQKSAVGSGPATAAPTGGDGSPDTVVATFGDTKITMRELEKESAPQLEELNKQRFDIRRQVLDQMVVQSLVRAAAAKAGQTEEQYLQSEIDAKIPPPPDAEVKKFYDDNKDKMNGESFEKVKPQIIQVMSGQARREAAMAIFGNLKAGAGVKILLKEPPKSRKTVEATGPSKGAKDAKVTIVEFSDFQCPFCSRAIGAADQAVKAYPDKVKLVFRHFPLDFHENAPKAAEASACADEQGKFWEMHDILFANQGALEVPLLEKHAATAKLDAAKFKECLSSGRMAAKVAGDMAAGRQAGVNGTPAFFINGILLSGAQPFEEFKRIIDDELAQ